MGSFAIDAAHGQRGVAVVRERLQRHPGTLGVRDLQDDRRLQRLGVDLSWQVAGLGHIPVEVKYERRASVNFALEGLSNMDARTPGWWITSHAALLFYGFAQSGQWWVIDLPALRSEVDGARWRQLRGVVARTPGSHETWCRLLPIEDAEAMRCARRLKSWGWDLGGWLRSRTRSRAAVSASELQLPRCLGYRCDHCG